MPELQIAALENKLEECKGQATQLRQDHLQARLDQAKERGDGEAIEAIKCIIKKERRKKLWVAARHVHGKKRGRSVLKVQVRADDGNVYTYDTQEEVEAAAPLLSLILASDSVPMCPFSPCRS